MPFYSAIVQKNGTSLFNIEARTRADHLSIQRHINLETITGTIIHEILYSISKIGLACYLKSQSNLNDQRWRIRLSELGATPQQVPLVVQRIEETLTVLRHDTHAAWLLDPTHQQAQSEWALYVTENNDSKLVIVDRTFIADNIRWIVDYKTDAFTTQFNSLADFLNAKKQEHQLQLQNYAKNLTANLYSKATLLNWHYIFPAFLPGLRGVYNACLIKSPKVSLTFRRKLATDNKLIYLYIFK